MAAEIVSGRTQDRAVKLLRAATLPLADQALMSAANLATTILVARALGLRSFGVFSLAYLVVYLGTTIQNALVTQPHNVLGAVRVGGRYRAYTGGTLVTQACLAGVLAAITLAVGGTLRFIGQPGLLICACLAAALVFAQFQEFFRRVHYTEGSIGHALLGDVLSYGGQVAAIALWATVGSLTAPSALLLISATSLVSAVWLARTLPLDWPRRAEVSRAVRENLVFGRWLAAAAAAYWLSTQGYAYLVAAFVGVTAAGTLRAALVVVGPLNILMIALSTALPIRLARINHAEGPEALARAQRQLLATVVPAAALVLATLAAFARPLVRLMYGDGYGGAVRVTQVLCLFCLFALVAQIYTAALRGAGNSFAVFKAYVCGLVCSALAVGPLLAAFGAIGAAVAMVIGSLATAVAGRALSAASMRDRASGPRNIRSTPEIPLSGAIR